MEFVVQLGRGIGGMVEAVRDRVEVAWHAGGHGGEGGGTWQVTAGSFEAALAYARERFTDPIVLSRRDRNRWWPRVTIEVTEDPSYAASAPPLDELAHPAVPVPAPEPERVVRPVTEPVVDVEQGPDREPVRASRGDSEMPAVLEEMFARQDVPVATTHRVPRQRRAR
ncbi:hypothetical protein EKO23_01330 [Nocardioides guangzhouensis]|uniref:Uncharacterized protein n=1 Tax=Nocardioides guangzhouensis TaxID=2497878 RepID=A0A4Q4ZMC7_9ACTN|nr:hypothetical protein [Nocardioides guangzhouensis]RYP89095.1 hypothetical protein EKO23_01330 [Nocardioides guangzhouensis]